jgi:hypothetical protein
MKCFLLFLCLAGVLSAAERIRLEDITKSAGLVQPLLGIMGHGGAWGDFDGDGHIDLYVGGFADRPDADYAPAKGPVANVLLRNLGNGKFTRVKNSPASHFARTSGAVFVDLDNDGDLELYVANNARPGRVGKTTGPQRAARLAFSRLYRNDGGKLVDISDASGACPKTLETGRNIGVLDFDLDGRLDLLLIEDGFTSGPSSRLFRNLGKLRFKDVTAKAGLPKDLFGLGCAIADVNGDGRPDFFVAHSNRFFLSSANGKYRESAALNKTFAWKPLHNEDWPCGVAFGDLNNDGRLDLVLGIHCETSRNRVYLNEGVVKGVPRFRDVTAASGMPARLPQKAPHVEIQDFDNDGRPDIFFSNGRLADGRVTPLICRNTGSKNKIPQFALNLPPDKVNFYFAASPTGDFDNDGRLDLILINWFRGNHTRLLRNVSAKKNWLQIRVRGKRMNRMGIGAKITVRSSTGARRGFQEIATGYGYASGQPALAHFGLGDEQRVRVEVRFPDGKKIQLQNVAANQRLLIKEK